MVVGLEEKTDLEEVGLTRMEVGVEVGMEGMEEEILSRPGFLLPPPFFLWRRFACVFFLFFFPVITGVWYSGGVWLCAWVGQLVALFFSPEGSYISPPPPHSLGLFNRYVLRHIMGYHSLFTTEVQLYTYIKNIPCLGITGTFYAVVYGVPRGCRSVEA